MEGAQLGMAIAMAEKVLFNMVNPAIAVALTGFGFIDNEETVVG
jgi:hypothetical protein